MVGSLIAADRALSAMSTMIRIANAGILLDRPLGAQHDHPAQPFLVARADRAVAEDLDQDRVGRHEVPDRVPDDHEPAEALAHACRPVRSIAWIAPRRAARATNSDASPASGASPEDLGRRERRGQPLEVPMQVLGHELRHRHRAQAVQHPIQEDHEQHQSQQQHEPGDRCPQVRTLILDVTEQRERERQRADEQRQQPFSTRSRYHSRMYRAENVPVAICTTRTVTVTTNPVSAAAPPTIDASTVLAVDAE